MSALAIRAAGLSKRYRLGQRESYRTLRDLPARLAAAVARTWRFRTRTHDGPPSTSEGSIAEGRTSRWVWALRDVSFEVHPGEVLSIIGRNGAGKSTLLKLLARITRPTQGRAEIRGRVGSLLEVGAGFHHELTGRENVYLDGAILGMKKKEIDRKLDEILDFAEIGPAIDTPVKYYSTGMYLRLAFAVAAHLEPDILLADEVLAVGDVAFQKKCLGKMGQVAREGRTVLLVSHNLGVVREISRRGIVLDAGQVQFDGGIHDAIQRYLSSGFTADQARVDLTVHPNRPQRLSPLLTSACSQKSDGTPATEFSQREDLLLEVEYRSPETTPLVGIGFRLSTIEGVLVGSFNTLMTHPAPCKLPREGRVTFRIRGGQFTPGSYLVSFNVNSHLKQAEDYVGAAIGITIHPADLYASGYLLTRDDGIVALQAEADIQAR